MNYLKGLIIKELIISYAFDFKKLYAFYYIFYMKRKNISIC